jgi:hypothetical protein
MPMDNTYNLCIINLDKLRNSQLEQLRKFLDDTNIGTASNCVTDRSGGQ